jgi:hypothetical protein
VQLPAATVIERGAPDDQWTAKLKKLGRRTTIHRQLS